MSEGLGNAIIWSVFFAIPAGVIVGCLFREPNKKRGEKLKKEIAKYAKEKPKEYCVGKLFK